jgi:hypothetical protein
MVRSRFWRIGLGLLILVIGLAAIGGAIQRDAWMQGYMMGQLAASGEGQVVSPYMPYGYPGSHSIWPWVIGIGLVLVLMAMAGKFLRFHAWKKAGGAPPEEWARHWRHSHGSVPPWMHHCEEHPAAEEEKTAPQQGPEAKE